MNDLMIESNTVLRRDGAGPSNTSRGIRRTLPLLGFSLAAAIMTGCGGGGGGGGGGPIGFQKANPQYATAGGGTYAAALEGNQSTDLPMYQQQFGGADSDANFLVRVANGGTINIETPNATYSWSGGQIDKADGILTASATDGNRTNSIESRYLDYTQFGVWESKQHNDALALTDHRGGAFHQGFETNPDNMPGTGSASYSGEMVGVASKNGVQYDIAGEVSMTANFGTGRVSGSIDTNNTFNNIVLNETGISGNKFAGNATVQSSGAAGAFNDSASGTYRGTFYGPSADEVGGTFLIRDGSNFAAGGFGGREETPVLLPTQN